METRVRTNEAQGNDMWRANYLYSVVKSLESGSTTAVYIANMYEILVQFDSIQTVMNNIRGEKTIRICGTGYQKRVNCRLAASSDGSKFPALVIFN